MGVGMRWLARWCCREREATHPDDLTGAEASAAIIPVVVLQLVDLDALPITERRSKAVGSMCHR